MLPWLVLSNLKVRLRVIPLSRSDDIEEAGEYSISLTILTQSAAENETVDMKLSLPVDVSKEQVSLLSVLLYRVVGDAMAPHMTEVSLYLNLSRSSVALYPLLKATSSVFVEAKLNKLAEEDILQP